MSQPPLNSFGDGDAIEMILLVTDKQVRANRQGNPYLHLEVRDRSTALSARIWNATESVVNRFESGDFIRARGKVQLFQGALQLILAEAQAVDPAGLDPLEFLPQSGVDPTKLLARTRELLATIGDPHLRALIDLYSIDEPFVAKLLAAPAGIRNHHAYRGGLIEHMTTMLEVSARVADLYPDLDRDILLVGVFLHDLGKLDELTYDRTFGYSDEGQLVGHLVMGVCTLREKLRRVPDLTGEPFPDELRLRLEHMIVSHHGAHEFGSPKLPMTPEAIALHHLDNLDAKLHTFTREIRDDPARGATWTPYLPSLSRRIFKGAAPSADDSGA